MKILTLSNCPLISSQGSGYVICGFAQGLRERGHNVELVAPEKLDFLPRLRLARNWRSAIGFLVNGLKFIRQFRPDVLEVYGAQAALLARRIGNKKRPFTFVHHSNGIELFASEVKTRYMGSSTLDSRPPSRSHRIYEKTIPWAFTCVDALVTVSEADRRFALERRLQPADRVLAIENPLPALFLDVPLELDRPKVIGFCGSWIKRKGIAAIQADLPGVLRKKPDWRFRLIGVGDDFDAAKEFPADVLSQIEVVPKIAEKTAMLQAYRALSILVCPSIYESFGLVIAEAMAAGCVVVATKTGFGADLVDGQDGVLMPDRGSPHLADCILKLVDNAPLRKQIAIQAHRRVQTLRWNPAVDRLENAYLEWHKNGWSQSR